MTGVRVTYGGNVLYCNIHRTQWLNLKAYLEALALVTGESTYVLYDQLMLTPHLVNDACLFTPRKVEYYTSS